MMQPAEAFDWLYDSFRKYTRNQLNWIDVRKILTEAETLNAKFQEPDDVQAFVAALKRPR